MVFKQPGYRRVDDFLLGMFKLRSCSQGHSTLQLMRHLKLVHKEYTEQTGDNYYVGLKVSLHHKEES